MSRLSLCLRLDQGRDQCRGITDFVTRIQLDTFSTHDDDGPARQAFVRVDHNFWATGINYDPTVYDVAPQRQNGFGQIREEDRSDKNKEEWYTLRIFFRVYPDIRRQVVLRLKSSARLHLAKIEPSGLDRGFVPDTCRSGLWHRNRNAENGRCQSALLKQSGLVQQKIVFHRMRFVFSD